MTGLQPRHSWSIEARLWWAALSGLGRPALALYLTLYLVFSVSIQQELWRRGGHVTPEQWSYHVLLDSLGFPHHHHGGEEASAQPTQDNPPRTSWAVPAPGLNLLAAPPDFLKVPFDGTLTVALSLLAALATLMAPVRRWAFDRGLPDGERPPPPTPPPSVLS